MDQELNKAMADFINTINSAISNGAVLITDNITPVIKDYLLYSIVTNAAQFIVLFSVFLFSLIMMYKGFTAKTNGRDEMETSALVCFWLGLFGALIGLAFLIPLDHLIQIALSPTTYLLEQAASIANKR